MTATNRRGFLQGMAAAGAVSTLGLTSCGKPGRLMVIVHGLIVPFVYGKYNGEGPVLVFHFPAFPLHIPAAGSFRREQILAGGGAYRLQGVRNGQSAQEFSKAMLGTPTTVLKQGVGRKLDEGQCFTKILAPIPDAIHGLRTVRVNSSPVSSDADCPKDCGDQRMYKEKNSPGDLQDSERNTATLVNVFEYSIDGDPRLTLDGSNFWQDNSVRNLHLFNEPFMERPPMGHGDCTKLFDPNLGFEFAHPCCMKADDPEGSSELGIDRAETEDLIERNKNARFVLANGGDKPRVTGDPASCMAPGSVPGLLDWRA